MSDAAGSVVLGVALLGMAVGSGWLVSRPSTGPRRNSLKRAWVSEWLWENARPLYVFFEKGFLILGGLGCLAGAVYCVKLAAAGR